MQYLKWFSVYWIPNMTLLGYHHTVCDGVMPYLCIIEHILDSFSSRMGCIAELVICIFQENVKMDLIDGD